MQCRDAQFYLRLRRHAGDELGAEVAADLDRHLVGCAACAADAKAAESFDRAVSSALRNVPVPTGLRDKLMVQASAHHGTVIRRKAFRVVALAASLFLCVGLAYGVFTSTRAKIDTAEMVRYEDERFQNPGGSLDQWLASQKLPPQLPLSFNTDLLMTMGTEQVQGVDIPVAVFRHPTDPRGFAKLYFFRTDGSYNLRNLQDVGASFTSAVVIAGPQHRDVKYVILHTAHPVNPGESPLQPFLRTPNQHAGL